MSQRRELKAFLATYRQFPAAEAMQDSALMECAEALAALEAEYKALWDAVIAFINAPGTVGESDEEQYKRMFHAAMQSRFWTVAE